MKPKGYRYISIFFAVVVLMLSGCREDQSFIFPEDSGEKVALNLLVENPAFETRDVAATEEEKVMSNLYVIAVRLTDIDSNGNEVTRENADVEVIALGENNRNNVDADGYESYTLKVYPGKYRFYVLANTSLYIPNYSISDPITEENQIKKIVLNYNLTQNTNQILTPGNLPMVCDAKDILYGMNQQPVNASNNYTVNVTSVAVTNIIARMTPVCAKVRYTIIYDNTKGGISEGFGTESIRFVFDQDNRAYATRIRKQNLLFPDGTPSAGDYDREDPFLTTTSFEETGYSTWALSLARYELSDELGSMMASGSYTAESLKRQLDNLTPWANDDINMTNWKRSRKRVWQGVIYLPENNEPEIEHTKLCFPYILGWYKSDDSLGEGEGDASVKGMKTIMLFQDDNTVLNQNGENTDSNNYAPGFGADGHLHGLERGCFYEVVARLRNPDDINFDIDVNVYVRPWEYNYEEGSW